jgi:hypothetical protein
MMRAQGYWRFHRSLADEVSDIWNSKEPFDQRSAWIDLINAAAYHDDRVFWVSGEAITLKRGEFFASIRYLARRWKWSKNRVDRFLKSCISRERISGQREGQHGTVYLIVNYALYQPLELVAGQEPGQTWDSGGTKPKEVKEVTTMRRAPRGRGNGGRATWLTPYVEAWKAQYDSEPTAGKLAAHLGKVHKHLGADECLARWTRYLADTPDVRHASGARFSETHPRYASARGSGAVLAIPGARDANDAAKLRRAGLA